METLSFPLAVCAGTTNPGYVAFLSQNLASPGSGSPFVVFVDPVARAVATAGYRADFRDLERHRVLWLP